MFTENKVFEDIISYHPPLTHTAVSQGLDIVSASHLVPDVYQAYRKKVQLQLEPRRRSICLTEGVKVTRNQFDTIYRLVEFAAGCCDVDRPQCYIVQGDSVAFSCGTRHQGLIGLSPQLIHLASEQELLSIIGHEIGHLLAEDLVEGVVERNIISTVQQKMVNDENVSSEEIKQAVIAYNQSQQRECFADRVGILCCQHLESAQRALLVATLKERSIADIINIAEYTKEHLQALSTIQGSETLLLFSEHPCTAVRLKMMDSFFHAEYREIHSKFSFNISL